MNQRVDDQLFDHQLAAWLAEEAGARNPDYLGEVLQRLDEVGQRRAWASLERWLPMTVITSPAPSARWRVTWTALVLALVSLIVASVVIVGSLVQRSNDADPTLQALVPTLQLEETWHPTPPLSETARLDEPMVGGVDADGNLYLVNGGTNHVLVIDPSGRSTHRHGVGGVPGFDFQDHPDDPYNWTSNGSVAVGPDGAIYVADMVGRRIHRFTVADGWSSWGGSGMGDGQFMRPSAVDVAPDGTVHVRDGMRKDVQRFDRDGTYLGRIGVREAPDGTRLSTGFMAFDAQGGSYVAEYDGDRLQAWDPDGNLRWAVPVTGTSDDEFAHPRDVAVDSAGNVYVTHTGVQVFSPDGRRLSEWIPPGEPTEVGIGPIHVATGPDDTVYVSLQMLDTIYKLKVVMAEAAPLASSAPSD